MTNQEILTKAIQRASLNGWQRPDAASALHNMLELSVSNLPSIYGLLFNHDFAKALWGEMDKFVPMTAFGGDYEKIGFDVNMPAWKYHLQQMVIADDPIKYLGENI